jgi:hypothetical protein
MKSLKQKFPVIFPYVFIGKITKGWSGKYDYHSTNSEITNIEENVL